MREQRGHSFAPPWRWGIFRQRPCKALLIDPNAINSESFVAIYKALQECGFKETLWQFVYPGQIGGLVRNPNHNFLELHVRFFDDEMIYGEIELGRSVLLHFVNRRLFINRYLEKMLGSKLSDQQLRVLKASTGRYKSVYDTTYTEWSVKERFMNPTIKRQIRLLSVLSDWRTLAAIMLLSVAASMTNNLVLLPIITLVMIFVYLLAPRRH